MKLADIWKALDSGETVCWENELYEIQVVESNRSGYAKVTERGDKALLCRCIDNGFGSLLHKSEFKACFIKERE